MDTLNVIMAAIILGAIVSENLRHEKRIGNLYGGLKELIQRKYSGILLEELEADLFSEEKQAALRENLAQANATEDEELLRYAQFLLAVIPERLPFENIEGIDDAEEEEENGGEYGGTTLYYYSANLMTRAAHINDSIPKIKNHLYPVWFGTTRKPLDATDITKGFSNQRDNSVHYGKCNVFIPESHRFGETGRPWFQRWIKLDFEDDNLQLREIVPCNSADSFWSNLQNEFLENEGDALVFLHGYNTSFEEAAIRAAQIGFDLKVSGATAFFSWASKGKVKSYPADAASIEGSEEAITNFLLDFTQKSGASKVHLLAHSMGNRGLLRALEKIQHKLKENSPIPFGQIILAAPDLDVKLFKDLAYLYPKLSERTTLYASPKDKAVGLSRWLHGYQRVGIVPPITVVDGIDTIKTEIEGFNLFELGHSYFAEAESILHDMFDLLRYNSSPSNRQRPIEAKTESDEIYWTIRN